MRELFVRSQTPPNLALILFSEATERDTWRNLDEMESPATAQTKDVRPLRAGFVSSGTVVIENTASDIG
jgi:hypothetical protein